MSVSLGGSSPLLRASASLPPSDSDGVAAARSGGGLSPPRASLAVAATAATASAGVTGRLRSAGAAPEE